LKVKLIHQKPQSEASLKIRINTSLSLPNKPKIAFENFVDANVVLHRQRARLKNVQQKIVAGFNSGDLIVVKY
jgi:hypothetical protein